jgi:hypothetical protein
MTENQKAILALSHHLFAKVQDAYQRADANGAEAPNLSSIYDLAVELEQISAEIPLLELCDVCGARGCVMQHSHNERETKELCNRRVGMLPEIPINRAAEDRFEPKHTREQWDETWGKQWATTSRGCR